MSNTNIKDIKDQVKIVNEALGKLRKIIENVDCPETNMDKGFCLYKAADAQRCMKDIVDVLKVENKVINNSEDNQENED